MRRKFAAQVEKKYLLLFNCVNYTRAYLGVSLPAVSPPFWILVLGVAKAPLDRRSIGLNQKIDFDHLLQRPKVQRFYCTLGLYFCICSLTPIGLRRRLALSGRDP